MKAFVCCKPTEKGIHSFYLIVGGEKYFLFYQEYRRGVQEYYRNGVILNDAMDFGKTRHDSALINTMRKIPMYIKYVEKENGIEVLKQTIKKSQRRSIYGRATV